MAGIGWNRLKMTDWMAMAGAVSALVFFKTVHIHRGLKAYMECLDPLSSMQKKLTLLNAPFGENFKKNCKKWAIEQLGLNNLKRSITKSFFLLFSITISASKRFV